MLLLLILVTGAFPAAAQDTSRTTVVVASKPFGESYLLSEMFAQVLEDGGYSVIRRPGLGATEIAFQALRTGAIDVYPEYTGTGLTAILHETPSGGAAQETFRRVANVFRKRWGIGWLPPLGFENTYAIAVRRTTADSLDLRTLSDLAREAPGLTAGFTPDFIGRPDGLPGLREAYDLRLNQVHSLLQAVKYQALAAGQVDVIDGYSTDGLIARYDLTVLEDDRSFFPPYQAAAMAGRRLMEEEPDAVAALTRLSGRITDSLMREWNERVEVENADVALVASEALIALGLGGDSAPEAISEAGGREGLLKYLWNERGHLLQLTLRHLLLVSISLTAGIMVAVPLGLALTRARGAAEPTVRGVGLLQTIPSIALLAFMIPLLGIGIVPALVALFLYSLYPILRNTYSGLQNAGGTVAGPASALGMTPGQVLRHVRLPLAAPVIMAGIRTAAVINVGTATLAAFIGAGGLGDPIVAGLALSDSWMILSGAIPAALLALLVDGVLATVEWAVRPRGV